MAAEKCKIHFESYENGRCIKSVSETRMRNSFDEIRDRVIALVQKDYPDVSISDVTYQRKELGKGFWKIEAEHNNITLLLKISRL